MSDPIGDALAIALEEMEEHANDERYRDTEVSDRIARVQAAMADLQLYLDQHVN